jgi:uncharacterized protein (DUF934 family)
MAEVIRIIDGEPRIVEDEWTVVRGETDAEAIPERAILPLAQAIAHGVTPEQGIWISPDDDFEAHADFLRRCALIAVDFPSFRDGRGYSIAYLLRTRYEWSGELRAIGDVLRDQLNYMRRCGFDCFALRADKNIREALQSFSHYSVRYQGAVDDPLPLFRRRNAA